MAVGWDAMLERRGEHCSRVGCSSWSCWYGAVSGIIDWGCSGTGDNGALNWGSGIPSTNSGPDGRF